MNTPRPLEPSDTPARPSVDADSMSMTDRATDQVGALARRSMDAMRESSQQWRDSARRASDHTARLVRTEPVKAMLIAAAAGAALMALVGMLTRSRSGS
jgi:ElaB/YqjD/DUF883 family membrane-anchored ribosome-binding protein